MPGNTLLSPPFSASTSDPQQLEIMGGKCQKGHENPRTQLDKVKLPKLHYLLVGGGAEKGLLSAIVIPFSDIYGQKPSHLIKQFKPERLEMPLSTLKAPCSGGGGVVQLGLSER